MQRQNWNRNWQFSKGSPNMMAHIMGGPTLELVQLPHDAMVHEARTKDTKNGAQTGFYPGGTYTYVKKLAVPAAWAGQTVILEFEGVYETAMVYVNGDLAATNLYGYSGFCVTLDKFLYYGAENEIRVVANNEHEANSRWYSGSGMYRSVNLLVGGALHIPVDGVRIETPAVDPALSVVEVTTRVRNLSRERHGVQVETVLYDGEREVARDVSVVTMFMLAEEAVRQRIDVAQAKLWSPDDPHLYRCVVRILEGDAVLDTAEETFGMRRLDLDAAHGLRINGEVVKLRGACIHHDNGILGAATLAAAEDRRCRQLKEAGFNSIRSAHHPISRAMLRACDKYGVLVMDELSDMWTNHKNGNDYALHFLDNMDTEVRRMVEKDYNHPSVVLYSTGNEIPDMGTQRGAQINRHLCNLFHELDPSRYTTNALNGFMSLGEKMGLIVQELQARAAEEGAKAATQATTQAATQGEGGSMDGANALNSMMGVLVGPLADALACHPIMTQTLEESSQGMDVIGLNYLTGRHELEHKLHPNRTVVGAETYPADIVRLWDIVKRNPHVLGDFTWTGYDYLGEAGCGEFYYDGNQNFASVWPDRVAYIGDIDLVGYRRPMSYWREIVYGLRQAPYLAVERVDRYGQPHSGTAWMWKDNIASWTWPGFEGKPANVDILSADDEVELFINGVSQGRQPAGPAHGFAATFHVTYEPGELLAVSYRDGVESGRDVLRTAGNDLQLAVCADKTALAADGEDLAFLTIKLTDGAGVENLIAQKDVTVTVEGAAALAALGNADPQSTGSFDDATWPTYHGYALAAVRAGVEAGEVHVTVRAAGLAPQTVTLQVQ